MLVFFKKKFNGVFFIILVIFLAVGVFSRYIYFRDYERLFLDIQTDTKIFQITSYFDQIEREGDSLIDATFHLHNDVNISAALRHRLSKSPFISAVGWVAKDGRFFYYENSNGESYYQKKPNDLLLTSKGTPVTTTRYVARERPWYNLPDKTQKKWSGIYNCHGFPGRKCLSFTLKPDEKDSENFNIERILIDVNIEYLSDFLNSISKPDEVLFISGEGYIVASNERARDSVLIDEGMNDFKVFSDGASEFIGISKKLQKYPDLYVHYFINLNHLDFFSELPFVVSLFTGVGCLLGLFFYMQRSSRKIEEGMELLARDIEATISSPEFNTSLLLRHDENITTRKIRCSIATLQQGIKENKRKLLSLVSFDAESGFYNKFIVIENNSRDYLAAGMLYFSGLEYVGLMYGSEKEKEITGIIQQKIKEKYSSFSDVMLINKNKYLLLCYDNVDVFTKKMSSLDFPQEVFCYRNIRLHTALYREAFNGKDVVRYADKLEIVLAGIREYPNSIAINCDEARVADADRKIWIARNIINALKNDEICVYYQPIVDLPTGKVLGAEALCRWNSPEKGFVPPAEFIPVAETCGLINELGYFVLKKSIHEFAIYKQRLGFSDKFILHINVSPWQLNEPLFYECVKELIESESLYPGQICIEITESVIGHVTDNFKNNLNLLRKYGVLLALDDFGCGLSNLKQLCDIAPDSIKVDKEFISGVPGHAEEILKFILALARTRNIPVIAEGVETQEGAQGLINIGITSAQGYLYQKPLPFSDWILNGDVCAK